MADSAHLIHSAAPAHAGKLAVAALLYAAFVVYGSLVPLDFHYRPFAAAWAAFLRTPYLQLGVASRADWVANILLYIPLAFLGAGVVASATRSRFLAVLGTIAVPVFCIALAFAVEFAQLYFPPRTVSQNDLIAEAIGTAMGIGLWALAGARLGGLWQRFRTGGAHSWQAIAALYAIAYLGYSLFPFDFLISAAELREKLSHSDRAAFLIAGSCGGVIGCTVKLTAEIALAAPLGALAGLAFAGLRTRSAFWIGLALGFAIETLQVLLASGVSQGTSVLARAFGMAWGLAFQHAFRFEWLSTYRRPIRTGLVVGAPIYLALVVVLNGFSGHLEPLWVARDKLADTHFLPFYYHYFTSETVALASLLTNAGSYGVIGIAAWLLRPTMNSAWSAGIVAALVAFAVESLKLFLPGKKPDPTDVLIAFAAAWIVNAALAHLGSAAHSIGQRAAQRRELTLRAITVAGTLTALLVIVGGLLIASPNRERAVDETTMPQLPPGHELPAVSLPDFRKAHPRLPSPTASELSSLVSNNPEFLRQVRNQANRGSGGIEAAVLQELLEPGGVDLDVLHRRLMNLEFSWRGHEQGKALALAYDWLYPRWSQSQRERLQDKLAEGCDYLIGVIRKERLSPYNVFLYNSPFQALMACSLALYGDDPRGEPVMRFTYDLWKNRVLPVWRQVMGKNGGWHEGGEYVGIGIGQAIHEVPAMWRSATGEDLFASEPGIRGFLDFLVYRTRPDGTHFRWGDGAFFDKIVSDATPLALEYRNAAAYSLRPPRKAAAPSGWPWGPFTDPALVDPMAAAKLPLTRYFDGISMLVARSDWSPEATYVTFKAGDNYWSHSHLDQGAFTIYRGGELAIDSGLYGPKYGSDHHMNYTYQTIAHNTITVTDPDDTVPAPANAGEKPRPIANDGGQRRIGSGWGVEAAPLDLTEWEAKRDIYHTATIERLFDQDGLTVAVADITPAYSNEHSGTGTFSHRTRRVERFWRTFGYDRVDDVVVIFDQVTATKASFRKRWLLHTVEEPQIARDAFSVQISPQKRMGHGGGRLEGMVLLPKEAEIHSIGGRGFEFFVDDRNYDENGTLPAAIKKLGPNNGEPGAWRIEVTPPQDAIDDRFLVVLLPTVLGERPAHRVRLLESGNRVGCEIVGPKRTTRWWFEPGRNGAEIETLVEGESRRHQVQGQAQPELSEQGWWGRVRNWLGR